MAEMSLVGKADLKNGKKPRALVHPELIAEDGCSSIVVGSGESG
jgi:hypothetical protein